MTFLRSGVRRLTSALRLLTVIPVPGPPARATPPPGTTTLFPVVGLLLGAALVPVALIPLPDPARGAALLAAWTGLTGGLHEDGWADVADATLAPVAPERRRSILKDPRIGAHGLTATVLLLLLRFGALASVPTVAVMVAPVVGRWAMASSLAVAPRLTPDGLGARYGRDASALGPSLTAALLLAGVGWGAGTPAAVAAAWAVGAGVAWLLARFLLSRLEGLNGDAHGAVGLAAETAALWTLVPLA